MVNITDRYNLLIRLDNSVQIYQLTCIQIIEKQFFLQSKKNFLLPCRDDFKHLYSLDFSSTLIMSELMDFLLHA
jgi:hypothetical protein